MDFIIISGLSGAGKSKAASFLEDIGFYVVDNMPAPLIPKFAELCMANPARYDQVALVTDIRGGQTFDGLCVALIENPDFQKEIRGCIPDEEFLRGSAPMTKSEVRGLSVEKLRLQEDSVAWDVGAGTGSVTVEMALRAFEGQVWAVEKKPEAAALIEENCRKFGTPNVHVVEGTAPEALEDLPAPTHVFIGGSSGNLKEILALVLGKNPKVRVVLNAITLETVGEANACLKELPFENVEITQIQVSKSKKVGPYQMMMGQNPVYIFYCQGKGED